MHPDKDRLEATLNFVDQLIHSSSYSDLEQLALHGRLTAQEIKTAIDEYPEELTHRPTYELEPGSIVHISESIPPEWSIYLHLWRKDGGRSDLTAELTLLDRGPGRYEVQIDNIHVL